MEHRPANHNFSEYEKFATDLYDDVDWLFARRRVPSQYEHFDDRYCKLQLTPNELEYVGPLLLSYAIDPPKSVEITLKGHNPYIYTNSPHGILWLTTEHDSLEQDTITNVYTIWIDRNDSSPINACKDVKRQALDKQPNEYGLLSLPLDLSHIIFSQAPIGREEQRALRALIRAL